MEWQKLSNDALRLSLALKDLSTNNETPLTLESVCDMYGIPRMQALSAIEELVAQGVVKKGSGTLKLIDDNRTVRFVKSKPERVEELEKQVAELKVQLKQRVLGSTSGLADNLPPEEKSFVREVEQRLGRGVDVNEAFLLGKCINGWGIPRTKQLLYAKWDANNPFVTTYAILSRGGRGKQFEPKKERPITYRERKPNAD